MEMVKNYCCTPLQVQKQWLLLLCQPIRHKAKNMKMSWELANENVHLLATTYLSTSNLPT